MLKRPLVVNLFAGPGAGKSTISSRVYEELKWAGVDVELVREFAKDCVWAKDWKAMNNQIWVSANQIHRQHILIGEVDVIVTDSPIILGAVYGASLDLTKEIFRVFNTDYHNVSYFLDRTKPYNPRGRRQSESSARDKDADILKLLNDHAVPFKTVRADRRAYEGIVQDVLGKLRDLQAWEDKEV
jgi:hypothetical protein